MHIAVAGLIPLQTETFVRRRRSGAYVNGVWTPGPEELLTAQGSITPARGADLLRLPEGRRGSFAIRIITTTELRISQSGTGLMADLVEYGGEQFGVEAVARWGRGFYDVVTVRFGD